MVEVYKRVPPRKRIGARTLASAFLQTCVLTLGAIQAQAQDANKELMLVDVVQAQKSAYDSWISLSGEVRAEITTSVAFEVPGQVIERLVDVGEHVTAGQILAKLDSTEQILDVTAAEAGLQAAKSAQIQAETTLRRQQELLDQGLTTRSAFDSAVESVATSQSGVLAAQATLQRAQEGIARTELRAFADGTITARAIEVGQVVQAGQSAFTLSADGAREAVFDVDEGALTETFASQSFTVNLFDDPEVSAQATLKEISPTIDKETGSVEVVLTLSDAADQMSLGSVVTTRAKYLSTSAFVLPAVALTSDQGRPAVWIVDPTTHAVALKPVRLEAFNNDSLVVSHGIEAQDVVVTAGANLVYPNQIVAVRSGQ